MAKNQLLIFSHNLSSLNLGSNNSITAKGQAALKNIAPCRKQLFESTKASFLMGTDPVLGNKSPILMFSRHKLFDREVVKHIFSFIQPKPFRHIYFRG